MDQDKLLYAGVLNAPIGHGQNESNKKKVGSTWRMPLYRRAKTDQQCKRQDFSKTTCNTDKDSVKQKAGDSYYILELSGQGYNKRKLYSTGNNS